MERWDVYDRCGTLVGRTKTRADRWEPDEYHLGASLWIINGKRELLIQRRSAGKKRYPNVWCSVGGSAIAGETSAQCCVREVFEEVGIVVEERELTLLKRFVFGNTINDDYAIVKDVAMGEMTIQAEEVDEVRWATLDDVRELFGQGAFLLDRESDLLPLSRFMSRRIG